MLGFWIGVFTLCAAAIACFVYGLIAYRDNIEADRYTNIDTDY